MWRARWYDSNANKGDSTLLALLIEHQDTVIGIKLVSWYNKYCQNINLFFKQYGIIKVLKVSCVGLKYLDEKYLKRMIASQNIFTKN